MTKRMLIDASHPEETRVAVLDGNRLEAFDIESANRLPLKGNIYLARVVRVEPSLQAAFVEYGGNRHGFLAFGEIHPDYYQIPVADRQRLLEMQRAEAEEDRRREEAEDAARAGDAALTEALESASGDGEPADESEPARIVTMEAEAAEATVPHDGVPVPEQAPRRLVTPKPPWAMTRPRIAMRRTPTAPRVRPRPSSCCRPRPSAAPPKTRCVSAASRRSSCATTRSRRSSSAARSC
jgi:ribonuclease E